MIKTIQEIILDFQSTKLQVGTDRIYQHKIVKNKASIYVGVRRSGKSTLLLQIVARLIKKDKIKKENILFLNLFDDRLKEIRKGSFHSIIEAYFSLYPEKKGHEKIYCFLDEIQETTEWERFVDRLIRTENIQVFLSGSSAKMLSKEIATQMRGRALTWEVFPFQFSEYLKYKKLNIKLINKDRVDSKTRLLLAKHFKQYFVSGAFPEVLSVPSEIRIKIHQEYFHSIISRDVIERFNPPHPRAVTELAYKLCKDISSLYSINRLASFLKELGYVAQKDFVSDCLQWFEDAYFLFSVKIWDKSYNRQQVNPKKIYCIDHSLVQSVTGREQEDQSLLLENLVFITLRRQFNKINYYKTKSGFEVDFIVSDKKELLLIQVSWSLSLQKTKERELRALEEAMNELGLKKSVLVTFNEEETISLNNSKQIQVIPAWKFTLQSLS